MTWSATLERWRPRLRLVLFVAIAGYLRCPSRRKGWVSRAKGERNLCVPKPKAQKKGGKKGGRKGRKKRGKKRTERIKRARSELEPGTSPAPASSTPAAGAQTKRQDRSPQGRAIPLRERPRPPAGRCSHEEPTP